MAVSQMSPPDKGSIIFQFEDLWCPEGYFRITLWRDAVVGDGNLFGIIAMDHAIENETPFDSVRITLKGSLITKLPIYEEETENYFTEITTNGFELGIYNTNSIGHVVNIERNATFGTTPVIVFGTNTDQRLLWRYIKPKEETELYGQWEFLPEGKTTFDPAVVGQCQNAIEGEDYRWIHADENNPYLDERANAPLDAEQIFDFKFVHAVHSALEKVPVMPITDFNNKNADGSTRTDSWYMPVWTYGFAPAPYSTPTYDRIPAIRFAEHTIPTGWPNQGKRLNPRWKGYIDAYYWLKLLFDYAYGEDKWNFECEVSPLQFESAQLFPMVEIASATDNQQIKQLPSGVKRSIRIDQPGQLFLPQGLWNAFKNGQSLSTQAIPETMWPTYHQSARDSIWEICICYGWVPIVWTDENGIAQIYFKDRTTAFGEEFTGVVPISAKPTAFPESESGIQVSGLKTFLNSGRANDGWYDDILAYKRGTNANPTVITEEKNRPASPPATVVPAQKNPYTVPATAKQPAKFDSLLRFGGYEWSFDDSPTWQNQVRFYGTDNPGISAGGFGLFWVPLTPLIQGDDTLPFIVSTLENFDLDPTWPDYVDKGPANTGNGAAPIMDYRPVMRGYFEYVDGEGATNTVTCDSFRQLLARFYATRFVKSDRKYELEEPTINKFWLINSTAPKKQGDLKVGDRMGEPSWQNVKLFRQRLMPDGKKYYLKRRVMDPNAMTTSTEFLRVEVPSTFLGGKFGDSSEERGNIKTTTPPTDPPTTGGGDGER